MKKYLSQITLMLVFLFQGIAIHSQSWVSLDGTKQAKDHTISVIESDALIHKVRMTIHGFHDKKITIDGKEYHNIFMDEGIGLQNTGEPQLPIITQTIAIPDGAFYAISIKEEKWKEIEIGTIFPAQKNSKGNDLIPPFTLNERAYRQNVYSPFIVSKGWEQNWRNIRNVSFSICPFKYYPVQNKLSVLTEFVLQVDFRGTTDKSSIRQKDVQNATEWHLFNNDIKDFPVENQMAKSTETSDNYDYLIIVGDSPSILDSQALQDFTKWKAFKGYKTKVVSTDITGTTMSAIKSYIAQEYNNYDIEYVLLIGDYNKIPLNYCYFVTEDPDNAHGDYWYGCLVGGDYDYYAEIPVGRFSTNSLSDFQNMVNKTIAYERFYNGNSKNALLVAHKENSSYSTYYQKCCENIEDAHNSQLSFTTAYGASGTTNSDVINHINNDGMNIVNYRGHGTPINWPVWNNANENLGSTQISNIDSTAIFFNVCCRTGDISVEPCMMEMLTRSPKGATACLAAVDPIWRFQGNYYNQQLFTYLLDGDIYYLGRLSRQAHIATIAYYEAANNQTYLNEAIYNAYSFLCGGDPALEIWTDYPHSISSSDISFSQSNGIMALSVSCLSHYSLSIVSESGNCLDRIAANGQSCSFPIPSGNFYAVVNCHNYYPYILYFSSSNYIQNETIFANSYYNYNGTPLIIGYDVTTGMSYGNVNLKSGSKVSIQNGTGGVVISNGFECEKGAELTIQ